MITVVCIGAALVIFSQIKKLTVRPVFVRVKANNKRKI
jgi:hypothetical protein